MAAHPHQCGLQQQVGGAGRVPAAPERTTHGPVFGLALTPDGKKMLLGCGPKVRQVPEAEAVLVPVPVK